MTSFWNTLLYNFFIAFGVMVGASIFAACAAIINNHPPIKTMVNVADSLKIWAVAVALGGTFSSIEVLDQGIFRGEVKTIVKQFIFIIAALIGANTGFTFITLIKRCCQVWTE